MSKTTTTTTETTGQVRHTPGPWFTAMVPMDVVDGYMGYGIGNGSEHIAVAALTKCLSQEESRANARLIAAAPELLEACKELVFRFEHNDDPADAQVIDSARGVIARAEGGAS